MIVATDVDLDPVHSAALERLVIPESPRSFGLTGGSSCASASVAAHGIHRLRRLWIMTHRSSRCRRARRFTGWSPTCNPTDADALLSRASQRAGSGHEARLGREPGDLRVGDSPWHDNAPDDQPGHRVRAEPPALVRRHPTGDDPREPAATRLRFGRRGPGVARHRRSIVVTRRSSKLVGTPMARLRSVVRFPSQRLCENHNAVASGTGRGAGSW